MSGTYSKCYLHGYGSPLSTSDQDTHAKSSHHTQSSQKRSIPRNESMSQAHADNRLYFLRESDTPSLDYNGGNSRFRVSSSSQISFQHSHEKVDLKEKVCVKHTTVGAENHVMNKLHRRDEIDVSKHNALTNTHYDESTESLKSKRHRSTNVALSSARNGSQLGGNCANQTQESRTYNYEHRIAKDERNVSGDFDTQKNRWINVERYQGKNQYDNKGVCKDKVNSSISNILEYQNREEQHHYISSCNKGYSESYLSDKMPKVSLKEEIETEKQEHPNAENHINERNHRQKEGRGEANYTHSSSHNRYEKYQHQHDNTMNDGQAWASRNSSSGDRHRCDHREKSRNIEQYEKKQANETPVSDEYIRGKEKDKEIALLKKINKCLQKENEEIKRRTNQLTEQCSKQMQNSDHFENIDDDLSSTSVAKKFKLLYDRKWTNLCKEISQTSRRIPEIKIIQCLTILMKSCHNECLKITDNQIRQFLLLIEETDTMPNNEEYPDLFALRKKYAQTDATRRKVKSIVKGIVRVEENLSKFSLEHCGQRLLDKVGTFLEEFIDCCWLMTVSRPSLSLNFDVVGKMYSECSDHFSVLSTKTPVDDPTKTAGTVYEVVWPCVLLKSELELYNKGDVILINKKTKDAVSQT